MEESKSLNQPQEIEYSDILKQAVSVIEQSQKRVAMQVSAALSNSYFGIGKLLYDKQLNSSYGDSIVKRLSVDLKQRYPKMGVSPRNLWDMKSFYERYKDSSEKVRQAVAVLPWYSNLLLMRSKLTDEQTLFYAQQVLTKGWNRDLLLNAVK